MKKDTIIIVVAVIALIIGVVSIVTSEFSSIPPINLVIPKSNDHGFPEAIFSGPLTLTKPQYKIYENIFIIIDGLGEDENGNIRFFAPDGRLYRTIAYDGAIKSSVNQYFRPDTSYLTQFCVQEEFVGEWTVTFDNNAYPPLKFEIINEHIGGSDLRLKKAC